MLKADVIKYFEQVGKVANTLNISHAAVSSWGEIIPKMRALEIEKITKGKLKYNEDFYNKKY